MANADFKARCKAFFEEADLDGKGTLSKLELYKVVNKSGATKTADEVVEWFDDIDTNDDDQITLEEFMTALCKLPKAEVKEANLRAAFDQFDLDKSGFITLDELKKILKKQGLDPETAELDMDVNKDGKVNYQEFLEAFRGKL